MLELKKLNKKYKQLILLDHVSLSLNSGDIAVLLGHSGVGKSTLLRVLSGVESLDSGEIFLDGEPLEEKPSVHRFVGMVFQDYNLFGHLSVEQNIIIPLRNVFRYTEEKAYKISLQLLQSYYLDDNAKLFHDQLSGGQKQRLAIARATAMQPVVLCMDEPTSALDPKQTQGVTQHITDLAKQGKIILIATHDVAILNKIDCVIYLMEGGQFVEIAPSGEFFSERGVFPKICGTGNYHPSRVLQAIPHHSKTQLYGVAVPRWR